MTFSGKLRMYVFFETKNDQKSCFLVDFGHFGVFGDILEVIFRVPYTLYMQNTGIFDPPTAMVVVLGCFEGCGLSRSVLRVLGVFQGILGYFRGILGYLGVTCLDSGSDSISDSGVLGCF